MSREAIPDFANGDSWYSLQLFFGRDKHKELSYAAYLGAVAKAFEACNMKSYHKTHAPRGSGAREGRQRGSSMDAIRNMGRWSNEHAVKSYAYAPPPQGLIPKAGFPDAQMYRLYRDVPVPDSLRRQIFPWIEEQWDSVKECTHVTPGNVLNVFDWSRDVLFQDIAILMGKYPSHPLFCLLMFNIPEFGAFQEQVLGAHQRGMMEMPESTPVSMMRVGLNVQAALMESKLLRQQVAMQNMLLAQQSAQLVSMQQAMQQLTEEMRMLRVGQVAHAAHDGVLLPAPAAPVPALPAAPTPLAALVGAVGQAQLAEIIAEVQERQQAGGASRERDTTQLLSSRQPQLQLLTSPGTLQQVLPSGAAGQQPTLSRQVQQQRLQDVRPAVLFEEVPANPSTTAGGSSAEVGTGGAQRQQQQTFSAEQAMAPYMPSPPPATVRSRQGGAAPTVQKYEGVPQFVFTPRTTLMEWWDNYSRPRGVRHMDETFPSTGTKEDGNWRAWKADEERQAKGLAPSMSTTFQKTLDKLMVFVTQVYKRCEGRRVSKAQVIQEMDEEQRGLGLTVTDYGDQFCRWLNNDCLKRKAPSATMQGKLKKGKTEEAARAVWESFWPPAQE